MPRPHHILIAGTGNALLADDGVGVHAVRALEQDPIPGVTVADIGTAVLHGVSLLESVDRVLVIDAAKGGRPPGTIYLFDPTENTENKSMVSLHAMGLREAVRLLMPRGQPPAMTVLGVEPACLDHGMELSGPVQAALPQVVALARETVAGWLRADAA
jgi:hydrogenase maturation protease